MLMELFFFKSRWLKCGLFDNILLTLFTYTCTIKYMLIHIQGCLGFTTTYTISAYHHLRCEFESRSWRDVIDTTCDVAFDRSVVFSVYYGFLHQYN